MCDPSGCHTGSSDPLTGELSDNNCSADSGDGSAAGDDAGVPSRCPTTTVTNDRLPATCAPAGSAASAPAITAPAMANHAANTVVARVVNHVSRQNPARELCEQDIG